MTLDKAAMWTDGRYYLQAAQQMDSNWQLMKAHMKATPSEAEWLVLELPPQARIGYDPFVLAESTLRQLEQRVLPAKLTLVPLTYNLVDVVWGAERPPPPRSPIFVLDIKFAGQPVAKKLAEVRQEMRQRRVWLLVLSALDEVAWLLNVRGSDVPCTPVFYSYALVTMHEARLYVESEQLAPATQAHLLAASVTVRPYDAIIDDLAQLVAAAPARSPDRGDADAAQSDEADEQPRIWLGPRASCALVAAVRGDRGGRGGHDASTSTSSSRLLRDETPVALAKAIKNATEIDGMRRCHVRDGAALVRAARRAWRGGGTRGAGEGGRTRGPACRAGLAHPPAAVPLPVLAGDGSRRRRRHHGVRRRRSLGELSPRTGALRLPQLSDHFRRRRKCRHHPLSVRAVVGTWRR